MQPRARITPSNNSPIIGLRATEENRLDVKKGDLFANAARRLSFKATVLS
jgi:hypothetical protein